MKRSKTSNPKTKDKMKKFIIALLLMAVTGLFGSTASAEVLYFKTTNFTYREQNSYGVWKSWEPWKASDMLVKMDLNTDIITIYSPQIQTYYITEYSKNYTDSSGDKWVVYKMYDQDYDKGELKLRIAKDGSSYIHIEYLNIYLCYKVIRKY